MNKKRVQTHERGIALLITLITMTVLLGISASLLNITLKQYQFASIGLASEMSFQAANAGMECLLYHDYTDTDVLTPDSLESMFDIGEFSPTIACMGTLSTGSAGGIDAGEAQEYSFDWRIDGGPAVCTELTIYKFEPGDDMSDELRRTGTWLCPVGSDGCTVAQSRGYNVACSQKNSPRVIERELTQRY